MTFFLHTHFTTISNRVEQKPALYHQLRLFHHYALGNIKTLARKICTDNAMLRFLDGHLNNVGSVNENFGREFLELYSIGKGAQMGADNLIRRIPNKTCWRPPRCFPDGTRIKNSLTLTQKPEPLKPFLRGMIRE